MELEYLFNKLIKKFNLLELELDGDISEEEQSNILSVLYSKNKLTIWKIEKLLNYVEFVPGIDALLVRIRTLSIGLARAYSIRRALEKVRSRGKKVFIYLESPGNIEYFIGSVADIIYMPPTSTLNLIGLNFELSFLKNLFDKVGIEAEIKSIGEFKSAGEKFTRNSMSESNRIMMESISQDISSGFVDYLSKSRNMDKKYITDSINNGPYTALEAKGRNLIDDTCYENGLEDKISIYVNEKLSIIKHDKFLKIISVSEKYKNIKSKVLGKKNEIAIIPFTGLITIGENKGTGNMKILGARSFIKQIKMLGNKKSINSVVIRVSSPGGSALASDIIWNEIKELSLKKTVIVSMSDYAASGGYFISLAGKKIISSPFTLTGSIGVISGKFNFVHLYKKLGVSFDSIKFGSNSDIYSLNKKLTEAQGEKIESLMRALYKDFVGKVAKERNITEDNAQNAAQGRVWTGSQAQSVNLVDGQGNIFDSVLSAVDESGMEDKNNFTVKYYAIKQSLQLSTLGKGFFLQEHYSNISNWIELLRNEICLTLSPYIFKIR
ncbi:MAG: signal peptide peptidase SppA [Thermodesulfobacteriota bacterium]